ncbi:hypothetical protein DOE78_19005 [Bacillus sp. Y1]|nr:hypothetical protein [Bacillus sp. Y1]AYA77370.1 hypothetical protein DOE78_19005 [Bacillus sp. Y1]
MSALDDQYKLREIITRELAENERDREAAEQRLRAIEVRKRELFSGLIGVNAEIERLKAKKPAVEDKEKGAD